MDISDVRHHFDKYAFAWTGFYGGNSISDYVVRSRQAHVLKEVVACTPYRGVVVEVGCGGGQLLVELAHRRPDLSLLGLDVSIGMLTQAKAAGVESASLADARHPPLGPHTVDTLVAVAVAEYLPDWRLVVESLSEVIRPGGLLVMTFAHRRSLLSWVDREYRNRWQKQKDGSMHRVQVDVAQVRAALTSSGLTVQRITPLSFDAYCLRYLLDGNPRLTKWVSGTSWQLDRLFVRVPFARILGRALYVVAQKG